MSGLVDDRILKLTEALDSGKGLRGMVGRTPLDVESMLSEVVRNIYGLGSRLDDYLSGVLGKEDTVYDPKQQLTQGDLHVIRARSLALAHHLG